jgi:hypothetical protein
MLVPEAVAETMWCPYARTFMGHSYAVNRYADGSLPHSALCLGSACMAWRWGKEPVDPQTEMAHQFPDAVEDPGRPGNVPDDWRFVPADPPFNSAHWVEPQHLAQRRQSGFCGLAGSKSAL